jgi:hypothetical protein
MPPDNAGYFHAAYLVAAVIYGGYIVVLWGRARSLRRRARGR